MLVTVFKVAMPAVGSLNGGRWVVGGAWRMVDGGWRRPAHAGEKDWVEDNRGSEFLKRTVQACSLGLAGRPADEASGLCCTCQLSNKSMVTRSGSGQSYNVSWVERKKKKKIE